VKTISRHTTGLDVVAINLLPYPRFLRLDSGFLRLPRRVVLHLDASLSRKVVLAIAKRLSSAVPGVSFDRSPKKTTGPGSIRITLVKRSVSYLRTGAFPSGNTELRAESPEFHRLTIDREGVVLEFSQTGGLYAGIATLRQLLREYHRRLPCVRIVDWPDFPRRGVMLDVSRGRVPKLDTLLTLADHLADFKINELQLYTEHTFAYHKYRFVWKDWGALTGREIRLLDQRCRELGIDLVPNQNSFGHLRYFLEHPPLKELAEVSEPYEDGNGAFLRYPSTLAPNHSGTVPFLRELYREFLPNFSSSCFNVGCDETWDLGRGRSRELCRRRGKGNVYLQFLKRIHREVSRQGRRMMFWGDIVLHHPEVIGKLPKGVIALNWGYEANHPFDREARRFEKSGVPFYVCPGTSTWQTLIGRHDNALANLRSAAAAGARHGAIGYLITDWGDGGHPQPLAVSYLPYLAGAALSWCATTYREELLIPVLNRDIFCDRAGNLAKAAFRLGLAHKLLGHKQPNATPFGIVVAAAPPEWRELFCLDGLKLYRRIQPGRILAARRELARLRRVIHHARPGSRVSKLLARELDMAARMAQQSCEFMLWQQALASGRRRIASKLASRAIRELQKLDSDFRSYWPLRNKGTTAKCSAFLRWRIDDYKRGTDPGNSKEQPRMAG
jgi:hexosaminidase